MLSHYRLAAAIGHRGVPARLPENTVEGLVLAAGLGYEWCEIDVQASSDGVAMVHHDLEVPGLGPLAEFDSATLAAHVVGEDGEGRPLRIPTLDECLSATAERGVGLVVEIKTSRGREREDAAATARTVPAYHGGMVMVSSFSGRALKAFASRVVGMPLALNVGPIPPEPPDWVSNVHFDQRRATPGAVRRLVDAGLGAYAFTVNDVSLLTRLLDMGAHGVFTDEPDVLAAAGRA